MNVVSMIDTSRRQRPRKEAEVADSEANQPRHRSVRTTETMDNPAKKPDDQIEEMRRAIDALHGMFVAPNPVDRLLPRLVKTAAPTDNESSPCLNHGGRQGLPWQYFDYSRSCASTWERGMTPTWEQEAWVCAPKSNAMPWTAGQ